MRTGNAEHNGNTSMIPLCCASREFALVDSPWLNGISSPQFPQAWPVVGRVNGFVCARTAALKLQHMFTAKPTKKNSWHVRVVGGLQARSAIRSRAAIASFRHCFGREDMQILRLDAESSLWPARPFSSHARMKDDFLPKAQRKKLCGDIVWAVAQVHQVAGLETPPYSQERRMNVQRVAD